MVGKLECPVSDGYPEFDPPGQIDGAGDAREHAREGGEAGREQEFEHERANCGHAQTVQRDGDRAVSEVVGGQGGV